MRYLDTREQKSPRFIEAEFFTVPSTLPAGDFLTGEGKIYHDFTGYGIEFKLSLSDQQNGDYGIHTEPIERFHDECANKIKPFVIKNPGVDFHAIWWVERPVSDHEKEMWDHFCYQYYIWGHVVRTKRAFIRMIKKIEAGYYIRDQPYIKRSHEEPTTLAKMLRQFPGVSSERAIKGAERCEQRLDNLYEKIYYGVDPPIIKADNWVIDDICGLTQANEPTALNIAVTKFVEGEE